MKNVNKLTYYVMICVNKTNNCLLLNHILFGRVDDGSNGSMTGRRRVENISYLLFGRVERVEDGSKNGYLLFGRVEDGSISSESIWETGR